MNRYNKPTSIESGTKVIITDIDNYNNKLMFSVINDSMILEYGFSYDYDSSIELPFKEDSALKSVYKEYEDSLISMYSINNKYDMYNRLLIVVISFLIGIILCSTLCVIGNISLNSVLIFVSISLTIVFISFFTYNTFNNLCPNNFFFHNDFLIKLNEAEKYNNRMKYIYSKKLDRLSMDNKID